MPQQKTGGTLRCSFDRGGNGQRWRVLLALKFTILTFTMNLSHLTTHVQVDNKVALAYLLRMDGTRNPQLLKISKSIWNYLLSHQITITAKYLPSWLNVRADWESRNTTDSSIGNLSESLSENNQTLRNPSSRSTCVETALPPSPIYGMEAKYKPF